MCFSILASQLVSQSVNILRVNNQDRTKNNGFRLEKFRFKREIGRKWISNKVVNEWNRLSNHIVSVWTMGRFKRLLSSL